MQSIIKIAFNNLLFWRKENVYKICEINTYRVRTFQINAYRRGTNFIRFEPRVKNYSMINVDWRLIANLNGDFNTKLHTLKRNK